MGDGLMPGACVKRIVLGMPLSESLCVLSRNGPRYPNASGMNRPGVQREARGR